MLHGDISSRLGADVTVLEDFESGDWSGFDTGAGAWDVVQGTAYEGSYYVTNTGGGTAYPSNGSSTRGNDYRFRYSPTDAGDDFRLNVGDQYPSTGNANTDFYEARADLSNDRLLVGKVTGGGGYDTWTSNSLTFSTGTEYRIGIRWGATGTTDNIDAYVLDASGSELVSAALSDDGLTGGTWALRSQTSSGTCEGDYVTERPL